MGSDHRKDAPRKELYGNLCRQIKSRYERARLKQVDLVRLAQQKGIKLGKSHVSQYVSGKTIPRTDILHFLADALQVDPDWLNNNNDNDSTLSDVDKIQTSADNSGGMKVREFKKSSKLNNVLYDVRGPVVDEAARMEEMGTHVLKLNIGNPAPFGFRTPDEVIYDMSRQLSDCEATLLLPVCSLREKRSCSMPS